MPPRSRSTSGLSGAAIDRAGRTLREFHERNVLDFATFGPALEVLRRFRREWVSGQKPLVGVYMGVKSMAHTLDIRGEPGMRLKREPRILEKLGRYPMTLSQMQDIGGVRQVVGDLDTLRRLRDHIRGRWRDQVEDEADYLSHPRADGYRAVHLIVRRHDHLVEIQLRTERQQRWATIVETQENVRRMRLRDLAGDPQTSADLRAISDALAHQDAGTPVPPDRLEAARAALDRLRIVE